MTKYEKPIALVNNSLAEGVYMASGVNGSACYSASAYIHQSPSNGDRMYRIQVNGRHDTDHTSDKQELVISFNQPVEYVSSAGALLSGNNTTTLHIGYTYWNNPTDNIGLGDVCVTSDDGLAITGCVLLCGGAGDC